MNKVIFNIYMSLFKFNGTLDIRNYQLVFSGYALPIYDNLAPGNIFYIKYGIVKQIICCIM